MSELVPARVYVLVGGLVFSEGTHYTHFVTYKAACLGRQGK